MSNEQPVYQEGEEVPVPDKGGWIDGETGEYAFGGPPPAPPAPPVGREDTGEQAGPKRDEPRRDEPKAPSVPRKDKER